MGTLKNISGEPLDVPPLRRTVQDGEEVEVPDSILTNADLVWPAGLWEVNGGSHEHDLNSPENTAKREGAAQDASGQPSDNIPTLNAGDTEIAGKPDVDHSLPTAIVEEN